MSRLYFPRSVLTDPRQMPELRRGLLDLAVEGGPWERSEMLRSFSTMTGQPLDGRTLTALEEAAKPTAVAAGPRGYSPEELPQVIETAGLAGSNAMNWNRSALAEGQLIHVAADLCDVLYSSIDSIPDDLALADTDAPTPAGLVVLSEPFIGHDATGERDEIRVDALLWGPVKLPPREEWPLGTKGVMRAFGLAAFRWLDPAGQDDQIAVESLEEAERVGVTPEPMWLPLGRSDWIIGDELTAPVHVGIDPDGPAHESMCEDRRLFAALWALLQQRRLIERHEVRPIKQARRRLERAGDRLPTNVEVVHLRRAEYRPTGQVEGERRVKVRFLVRPHWRRQAHGPDRSLRKLILVPPHMKGPEGAPLQHVERVWSVDR